MTAHTPTTTCARCGRVLTSPASIRRGYGAGCWTLVRAGKHTADLADYKPHQIDSARELLEDGGLLHLRNNIFLAVSSDGTRTHRTTAHHCTCHAGLRSTPCFHTAAARWQLATTTTANTRPTQRRVFALAA